MKGITKFKSRNYFVIEDQRKKSHLKRWDIFDTGGTNVSRLQSVTPNKRQTNMSFLSEARTKNLVGYARLSYPILRRFASLRMTVLGSQNKTPARHS